MSWELGIFAFASMVTWLLVWRRLRADMRLALGFFSVVYVLTFAIGATWIGIDPDVLQDYLAELWIPRISDRYLTYWALVFGPLIIPPWVVFIAQRFTLPFRRARSRSPQNVWIPSYLVVFAVFSGIAIIGLLRANMANLSTMMAASGDTDLLYEARDMLFSSGSQLFFGTIYVAMPFLAHVALACAVHTRSRRWWIMATIAILLTTALGLATVQISIPVVFLASIVLGYWILRGQRMRILSLVFGALVVFFSLDVLSSLKYGDMSLGHRIRHYSLRLPHAFPYYLETFPDVVNHPGVQLLGDLLGRFQETPPHSFTVGEHVYPDSSMPAALPAPMHVTAYADAGLANAILYVFLLSGFIVVTAWIYRRFDAHPFGHGIAMQCLTMLYYLSQVGVRGAIWQSYGIIWAIGALAALLVLHPRSMLGSRAIVKRDRAAVSTPVETEHGRDQQSTDER